MYTITEIKSAKIQADGKTRYSFKTAEDARTLAIFTDTPLMPGMKLAGTIKTTTKGEFTYHNFNIVGAPRKQADSGYAPEEPSIQMNLPIEAYPAPTPANPYQAAQDNKAKNVETAQSRTSESVKIAGSLRDAVSIVTVLISKDLLTNGQTLISDTKDIETIIKEKINTWQTWLREQYETPQVTPGKPVDPTDKPPFL